MKDSLVTRLRRQVEEGHLENDSAIEYRLRGGTAEDRIDESVTVTATGGMHVRILDRLEKRREGEAGQEVGREAALDLFRLLLQGVESMIPASEARFVPDTLIASVTVIIGDEKEAFCFLADEEESRYRGQLIKPELKMMLDRLRQVEAGSLYRAGRVAGKESE